MPRKAMWKGVVTFDHIFVPVKLYSAVEDQEIAFHLIHDQDKIRLKQQMVCEMKDDPVPDEEIIKGVEVAEHKYVLLEPADPAELQPECERTINVEGFIKPDTELPLYFDRPYHLGPDSEEQKYASLVQALAKTGEIGICRWCFRKRFYNGALFSHDGILKVVTLRLAGEVLNANELGLPHKTVSEKERKTAKYLIDELTSRFKPSEYHNDFQKDLASLIETKAKGGEVKLRKGPRPRPTESDELLIALEKSLKEAGIKGRPQR